MGNCPDAMTETRAVNTDHTPPPEEPGQKADTLPEADRKTAPEQPAPRQDGHEWLDSGRSGGANLLIVFFFLLLCFTVYLCYMVVSPFFHSFVLAAILSALSFPIYARCEKMMGNRRVIAAAAVLCLITLLVAVPITFFVAALIPQAGKSISAITLWLTEHHLGDIAAAYLDPLISWANENFPEFEIAPVDIRGNLLDFSRKTGQFVLSYGTIIAGNTLKIVAHFLLVLLFMFYFFLNGPALLKKITYLSPLKTHQTTKVIESMRSVSRSVFVGGLLVAFAQGTVGGMGLAYVGIPGLFWGTVMGFTSLVPVVGTSLVWVPASIYLYLSGETAHAIMIVVWSIAVVGSIDTILRPLLLRDSTPVPVVFLFISILGGVSAFGMLGILYGPMIIGLVVVMLTIYDEEYKDYLSSRKGAEESPLEPIAAGKGKKP
jgi:Predicted permease